MGRKRLVTDEQLLDAARSAFVELGAGASTREIARRAGVSEAVLFQRYATKADLFASSMAPPPFDFAGAVGEVSGQTGEAITKRVFLALLDYFRKAAPVLIQMQAAPGYDFEVFAERHPENPFIALRPQLVQFLTSMGSGGKVRADARWAALNLFTTAYGVAMFERMGQHGGEMPEWILEGLADSLWRGMESPARAGRKI